MGSVEGISVVVGAWVVCVVSAALVSSGAACLQAHNASREKLNIAMSDFFMMKPFM